MKEDTEEDRVICEKCGGQAVCKTLGNSCNIYCKKCNCVTAKLIKNEEDK